MLDNLLFTVAFVHLTWQTHFYEHSLVEGELLLARGSL